VIKIVCGVDVSKDWLDAHIRPCGAVHRFANHADGIAELASVCHAQGVELVVMEASGGCERDAFAGLWAAGLACAIVNPRQVRRFAEAMGYLEKTDRLDAAVIAHYGQVKPLAPTPLPSPAAQRLKALMARLSQLVGDLTVNKQRRAAAHDPDALASLRLVPAKAGIIALLTRQSRQLAGEIASLIDDDPLWARLDKAFRSIKGVAGRTVARLLAELPEIGTLTGKAAAKLAGLAPIADDTGRRSGRRSIRGGRAGPRSLLFLVAGIAAKYDPRLMAFHQRLKQAGKAKMVIRIALAHKLLVILNYGRGGSSQFVAPLGVTNKFTHFCVGTTYSLWRCGDAIMARRQTSCRGAFPGGGGGGRHRGRRRWRS
jgi:transposase